MKYSVAFFLGALSSDLPLEAHSLMIFDGAGLLISLVLWYAIDKWWPRGWWPGACQIK